MTLAFNPATPIAENLDTTCRYLSDLEGVFADASSYQNALSVGNPLLYQVQGTTWGTNGADLICAFGMLYPGKIGDEYFLTKGHYHTRREAAEIYQGLSGEGYMLLEDEFTHETQLLPLMPNTIVYVPGHTAHRTINTGTVPLTYIGINVADAGHDYGAIQERNFKKVVIERDNKPVMVDRAEYLQSLKGSAK